MTGTANGENHEIGIKHKAKIDLNELGIRGEIDTILLNFLNTIIKSGLRCKDFKQIGRLPKFFLPGEYRPVPGENLEMWPGYET